MPTLEHAIASSQGSVRSKIARDSYSLIHFLMLAGVIAYAVSIEEAIAHPTSSLPPVTAVALALGITLFVSGMAAALWRATGKLPLPRVFLIIATGLVIVAGMEVNVILTLGTALVGVAAIGLVEKRWRNPISNDQRGDNAD